MADDLTLAENACLCLVNQGVGHGWAVGSLLAPEGELGRVWSLSRPLTYRALDQLATKGHLSRSGTATGRAAARTLLEPTVTGRRIARRWLDLPSVHLRDVRTEVLLKLLLRERQGLAASPFVTAQAEAFAPIISALTRRGRSGDPVDRWRAEHARAVDRFLRSLVA